MMWPFRRREPEGATITLERHEGPTGYVSPFAKTKEDIAAGRAAEKAWKVRCAEAVKGVEANDTQPAYKITHEPEGYFCIRKKEVLSADYSVWTGSFGFARYSLFHGDYVYPAEHYEKEPTKPAVNYTALPDYRSPLGKDLYGYDVLRFHTLAEAEGYLTRMLAPQDNEVGYDFPPLTRRESADASGADGQGPVAAQTPAKPSGMNE